MVIHEYLSGLAAMLLVSNWCQIGQQATNLQAMPRIGIQELPDDPFRGMMSSNLVSSCSFTF